MKCHRLASIVRIGLRESSRSFHIRAPSIAILSPNVISIMSFSTPHGASGQTMKSSQRQCDHFTTLSTVLSQTQIRSISSVGSLSSNFSSCSHSSCSCLNSRPCCAKFSSFSTKQSLRDSNFPTNSSSKMAFTAQEFGSRNSADFRVFYSEYLYIFGTVICLTYLTFTYNVLFLLKTTEDASGNVISPWHD